ncbi:MAG: hypothetical protein AAGE52_18115 [Myxococcota bacterium]
MAARKKGPPGVRRGGGPRRRLPEDLEEFARSDEKRFRPKRKGDRRPRLKDPRRAGALIPGVANRDARRVYDARASALQKAEGDLRGDLLAEAVFLQVWRGFSITGFDAFVEDALGLSLPGAREEAEAGAARLERPLEALSDRLIATWIRAESALVETGGRVTCRGEHLHICVPFERSLESLQEVNRRIYPLLRDHEEESRPREPRRRVVSGRREDGREGRRDDRREGRDDRRDGGAEGDDKD